MRSLRFMIATGVVVTMVHTQANAEVSEATIESLSAPKSVQTRVGNLEFRNGVPSAGLAKGLSTRSTLRAP